MWHSLVARIVRDDEAAGSNPVIPTSKFSQYRKILAFFLSKTKRRAEGFSSPLCLQRIITMEKFVMMFQDHLGAFLDRTVGYINDIAAQLPHNGF